MHEDLSILHIVGSDIGSRLYIGSSSGGSSSKSSSSSKVVKVVVVVK